MSYQLLVGVPSVPYLGFPVVSSSLGTSHQELQLGSDLFKFFRFFPYLRGYIFITVKL